MITIVGLKGKIEIGKYIAVIGSLNMDMASISGAGYRERDSNLEQIQISPGGKEIGVFK